MRRNPKTPAAKREYGSIHHDELLPLPVVRARLGWGHRTVAQAQRDGLRTMQYGKWKYVLGADLIDRLASRQEGGRAMKLPADPLRYLTPPTIARRLGVDVSKVYGWIRRGELRAADVSERPGTGKPRFRIDPGDLADFLNGRAVVPPPAPAPRRRRNPDVIRFF